MVADDDEKMSEGVVDKSAMSPDGERSDPPDDGKRNVEGDHVDLDLVRAFKRTRHCPACESGMSAPGIRHNAECKDLELRLIRLVKNMRGFQGPSCYWSNI